ncbi:MAG TPA: alpha-amylase family glycosyl hydrolase, partial [Propionibacteriaceae bacterium]|nr:alpha-amylase family glycosyl hydrolase [Propionibacteriaceae bacterium]
DYRDIHPDFGTLVQADRFVAMAHELGLRVLIDLVPNHSSDQHPWFQAALRAGKGSPERELYVFRDGLGEDGDIPPNNWPAMFGGRAWERTTDADGRPGQWYLHLFAPEQPDWNWDNPAVADEFDAILRFWFDRGVDGFRIDVANSMVTAPGLPDLDVDPKTGDPVAAVLTGTPYLNQPGIHDIFRRWRRVADSYADTPQGPRIFVSEAYVTPASELARYIRPGELHTTFNFDALLCEWTASSQRNVIDLTLAATAGVGAPSTWVLANHDITRVVTRYGRQVTGARFTPDGMDPDVMADFWSGTPSPTDVALGRRRARAAALLELALPGGAYIYQGDELGLEEVEDLPEDVLQDPTWVRSGHTQRGRDGCRVPIPWSGTEPPFGFGSPEHPPWLPQPAHWSELTVEAQQNDPTSMLNLYRAALAERRRQPALGDGSLHWDDGTPPEVLSFTREPGFRCVVNFGPEPYPLPEGSSVLGRLR